MNVALLAKQLYAANEPPGAFSDAILRCLFRGVIIRRGNLLILTEPTYTDGNVIVGEGKAPNCWWVHFVAAEKGLYTTRDWMNEVPYPLPWVGYRRRGKTKLFRWERIRKEIYANVTVSRDAPKYKFDNVSG
jgi:hypothetical protein